MKRRLASICFALIFLVGLSVALYPAVSNFVNEKNQSRVVASYDRKVAAMEPEDYSKEREAAQAYNTWLSAYSSLGSAASAEAARGDSPYRSLLDVAGSGVMGVIKIPKIRVSLPIYHTVDEAILQVGAGHYIGSSLPVGGSGTHVILTGHRGLPSAKLFTDLDQLVTGDVFYLHVLNEMLEYQVDQIEVVLPEEVSGLGIVEGEDYVTLVTCTPYGVNSHRMLIRGTRIPYDGNDEEKAIAANPAAASAVEPVEADGGRKLTTRQWMLIGAGAFALAIIAGLLAPPKKTKKNGKEGKGDHEKQD